MPPLRQLKEDIPLLVKHFIAKHKPRGRDAIPEVSPEAMAKLMDYNWPGMQDNLKRYPAGICN